jgi:AmpD protein
MSIAIENHWINLARVIPSPNYGPRPSGVEADLIVIHNISLPPGEYGGGHIEALFTNKLNTELHPFFKEIENLKVSSHLVIERDGSLLQFVGLDQRAWHAGWSEFEGRPACNDFSIGIELEGSDLEPFTNLQYEILNKVLICLLKTYTKLSKERLVGHSDIAPGRKTDPGPYFDWSRVKKELP